MGRRIARIVSPWENSLEAETRDLVRASIRHGCARKWVNKLSFSFLREAHQGWNGGEEDNRARRMRKMDFDPDAKWMGEVQGEPVEGWWWLVKENMRGEKRRKKAFLDARSPDRSA